MSFIPPPLPDGWSQHFGPDGLPYYYNAHTNESTYIRPIPAFPLPPVVQQQPKKKDKPLVKTPIPDTDWIRVKTTLGNIFYSHKTEKRSVWTIPDEIKDIVEAFDAKDKQDEETKSRDQEEEALKIETQKVKAEILEDTAKRKAEDPIPVDEVVISKKARVEDEVEEQEDEESDTEDWQREAAAQLAVEAEQEERRKEEEQIQAAKEAQMAEQARKDNFPLLNMPDKVDLSIEEGKALFKTLLREKDVNPLHPWDIALPLFISDARYVLLPSVSSRREAFDEYCRDRAREIRQSKVSKEKEDPREEFEKLLNEEVKSTRTSWSDFRRQWKKDRRFYGWGRDEREREKRFREYLKELGEKKKAAAQKADTDFFVLLRASGVAKQGSLWKDVKRHVSSDPRYEAVGSSSLREELFNTFLKASATSLTSVDPLPKDDFSVDHNPEEDAETDRKKREKKERAVRGRQEKVRSEMNRVEADIGKSRMGLYKEEDEREFRTLLTDAIRNPEVTWDKIVPQLQKDPRFTRTQLPINQQLHLFHEHVGKLRAKHVGNMHALFASHASSLATPFSSLPVDSLLSSLSATKLGFDMKDLQHEYERWQRERNTQAHKDFDLMLSENSFVEFWGRLGKIGGKGLDETIQNDDIGEDDPEDGDRVDMKKLAKGVDVKEIVKVLKNDKRYIMFDHVPEQREQWVRDYVSNMTAPQLSVHVPEKP